MDDTTWTSTTISDSRISFNFNRQPLPEPEALRRIIIGPHPDIHRRVCLPGLNKAEKELWNQLKSFNARDFPGPYSLEFKRLLFLFSWRFVEARSRLPLGDIETDWLDQRAGKEVSRLAKKFTGYLQNHLVSGAVFALPDREVDMGRRAERRKVYARPVLAEPLDDEHLLIIPFSTKQFQFNQGCDMVFDPRAKQLQLGRKGHPFIDNRPYSLFRKMVVLKISAAQPMSRADFLAAACGIRGRLTMEVQGYVKNRLSDLKIHDT